MDPNLAAIMGMFTASMATSFKAQADHHVGLMARQGDFAAQDNRMITSAVMNELFTGTGAKDYANLQTASHVPGVQQYPAPAPKPA